MSSPAALVAAPFRRVPLVFAIAAAALVALLLPGAARAQPGRPAPVRASVLTFGPGDHPFFKFGHNALLIEDESGRGTVYNFGTFSFDSALLIPKFLRGRLTYWLSRAPRDPVLFGYQDENRSIEIQELDLGPEDLRLLAARLDENARPQNREYLYDYFWDNCSTRVRDAVDGAVGGRLRTAAAGPAAQTFREHALRMTADLFPEYLGLNFGLGSLTDQPLDLWKEAFLPERLRDLLRTVKIPAAGGGEKPLVKAERVLFKAAREDKPAGPPGFILEFSMAGVVLGGLLSVLGARARKSTPARVSLGVLASLLGLVFGFLGLCLVLLWGLTNHRAAYANANILQTAPWLIALVVYGVGVARGRDRAIRRAFWVAAAATVAASVGLLAKLLPGVHQQNGLFIAFFLPLWFGLSVALKRLAGEAIRLPRLPIRR